MQPVVTTGFMPCQILKNNLAATKKNKKAKHQKPSNNCHTTEHIYKYTPDIKDEFFGV